MQSHRLGKLRCHTITFLCQHVAPCASYAVRRASHHGPRPQLSQVLTRTQEIYPHGTDQGNAEAENDQKSNDGRASGGQRPQVRQDHRLLLSCVFVHSSSRPLLKTNLRVSTGSLLSGLLPSGCIASSAASTQAPKAHIRDT